MVEEFVIRTIGPLCSIYSPCHTIVSDYKKRTDLNCCMLKIEDH